jgi:hypothetical protein
MITTIALTPLNWFSTEKNPILITGASRNPICGTARIVAMIRAISRIFLKIGNSVFTKSIKGMSCIRKNTKSIRKSSGDIVKVLEDDSPVEAK